MAARDERDDLPGRRRERGLALGGVERRDPARGPGADIYQPSAAAEGLGDDLDHDDDLARRLGHGRRDGPVLCVHQPDEFARRADVVVGVRLVRGFRRERVEAGFVDGRGDWTAVYAGIGQVVNTNWR